MSEDRINQLGALGEPSMAISINDCFWALNFHFSLSISVSSILFSSLLFLSHFLSFSLFLHKTLKHFTFLSPFFFTKCNKTSKVKKGSFWEHGMDHRSVCCDGHVVDELVDSTVWEEWWEDCGKRQSPKRKLWLAFTRRDPWFHSFWLHFFPCHLLRKTQVFVSFYPHPTSCLYTYIYFCFFFSFSTTPVTCMSI